jgi:hypothetical protein
MAGSRRVSPSLGVAVLALFVALGGSAVAVTNAKPVVRCGNGSVKAYAAVDLDRFTGPFPQQFSAAPNLFVARFSCNGQAAQARVVGAGRYDIRFPGIASNAATVTIFSDRPGTVTWRFVNGMYQIRVLDPSGNPTERGFAIAVF